jgi:hypothetical protein
MKIFNIPWEEYRTKPDNLKGVTSKLIRLLDELDIYVGSKVVTHCVVDQRNSSNYHTRGMACDLHIEGLDVVDQFIVAGRFPFTGIGMYAEGVWNNPGLHLDIREVKVGARWARIMDDKGLRYVPLDMEYIRRIS